MHIVELWANKIGKIAYIIYGDNYNYYSNAMERLIKNVLDAAYEVHLRLAPGYLESVYRNALMLELAMRGLSAKSEFPINVMYKNHIVGAYRADIFVEDALILELKSISKLTPAHSMQLVNYLTSTGVDYGLLINFGADKFEYYPKTRLASSRLRL